MVGLGNTHLDKFSYCHFSIQVHGSETLLILPLLIPPPAPSQCNSPDVTDNVLRAAEH